MMHIYIFHFYHLLLISSNNLKSKTSFYSLIVPVALREYIYSLAFCGFQRKFISSPQASLTVFIDLENGFLYYTSQAVSISVKIVQTA